MRRKLAGEDGSVFTVLLAGVALVAVIGVASYNVLTGPVATMAKSNLQTRTVNDIATISRILLKSSGDCDSDGVMEPPAYGGTGAQRLLPANLGAPTSDPWGTPYMYCAFDTGAVFDSASCGGPSARRYNGSDTPTSSTEKSGHVFAVISAGPDRQHQTTCANYVNETTAVVSTGGDDIYETFTYQQALDASPDYWLLNTASPNNAETAMTGVDIGSSATKDMVAHWRLDETGGTLIKDEAGTLDGTWSGTPSTVASVSGKVRGAINANPSMDITVNDPGANSGLDFAYGETMTLAFWYRPTAYGGYIINKGVANSNYRVTLSAANQLSLRYYSNDGVSTNDLRFNGFNAALNEWHHFALILTYGTPASAKLYVNGLPAPTYTWTGVNAGNGLGQPVQTDVPVAIADGLTGALDDLRLYKRALSASEVGYLFNPLFADSYGACAGLGTSYTVDPATGHCYFKGAATMTWAQARDVCLVNNADLAKIDTAAENALISASFSSGWIGGTDAAAANQWKWVDGTSFWSGTHTGSAIGGAYHNWDIAASQPGGWEDYTAMHSGGKWHDWDASTATFAPICEKKPATPTVDCTGLGDARTTDPATGSCYFRVNAAANWTAARNACVAQGARLAKISSAAENTIVRNLVTGHSWIGGTDSAVDGVWRWTSDDSVFWNGDASGSAPPGIYANWTPSEPNDPLENCMGIAYSGSNGWDDYTCTATRPYVCEKEVPQSNAIAPAARLEGNTGLGSFNNVLSTGVMTATGGLQLGAGDNTACGPAGLGKGTLRYRSAGAGAPEPVAHFKFDETSGLSVADAKGGSAGTLNDPSITFGSGHFDGAITFPDTYGTEVTVPYASTIERLFEGGGTVTFWIRPTGTGHRPILQSGGFQIGHEGSWFLAVDKTGQNTRFQSATATPATGQWQHVAVVYNSDSDANDPVFYINGVADSAYDVYGASGTPVYNGSSLRIGEHLHADLDDLRFYDTALSASDISDLYTATSAAPVAAGSLQFCDGSSWTAIGGGAAAADCTGLGEAQYTDPDTGTCYYRGPEVASWAIAQAACQANGDYLAQPTSQAVNDKLYANIANMGDQSDILLGGRAAVSGDWRWQAGALSGTQFWSGEAGGSAVNGSYTNWETGEPNNGAACLSMGWAANGKWSDTGCDWTKRYLCERPLVPPTPPAPPADCTGLGEATLSDSATGHCYVRSSSNMNWVNAQSYCQSIGANLVKVDDAAEQTLINALIPAAGAWNGGRYYPATTDWRWVSDNSIFRTGYNVGTNIAYTNWQGGQPSGGAEEFVQFYSGGNWNDTASGTTMRGICEKEPSSTGLTAHFKLEETTGTALVSAVGTATGSATGTTFDLSSAEGRDGGAFWIRPAEYINIPVHASINNIWTTGGSVSFWFNAVASGNTRYLLYKLSGLTGWGIYLYGTNLHFSNGFSTTAGNWSVPIQTKRWYHVTVAYDKGATANDPKFYIDGVAVVPTENTAPAGTSASDAAQALRFGFVNSTSANAFIDDVRFYDRQLTDAEAYGVYLSTNNNTGDHTVDDTITDTYWQRILPSTIPTPRTSNLQAHYAMDEKMGAAIKDYATNMSGNVPSMGRMVGGQPGWQRSSILGPDRGALGLGSSTYGQIFANAPINNIWASGGTVAFWTKLDGMAMFGSTLMSKTTWSINLDTSQIILNHDFDSVSGSWGAEQAIPTGEWVHMAITYNKDSAANIPAFYVNGTQVTMLNSTMPVGTASSDASADLLLNPSAQFYAGITTNLDDLRFYSEILTAQEIADLYNATNHVKSPPIYYSSGNVMAGTNANDATYLFQAAGPGTDTGDALSLYNFSGASANLNFMGISLASGKQPYSFLRSRGTEAAPAPVAANDLLGALRFLGNVGGTKTVTGGISASIVGGVSGDILPGVLSISNKNGATLGTLSMSAHPTYYSKTNIGIGTSAYNSPYSINALSSDGSIEIISSTHDTVPDITLARARGEPFEGRQTLTFGDYIGSLQFQPRATQNFVAGSPGIYSYIDRYPTPANSLPSRLILDAGVREDMSSPPYNRNLQLKDNGNLGWLLPAAEVQEPLQRFHMDGSLGITDDAAPDTFTSLSMPAGGSLVLHGSKGALRSNWMKEPWTLNASSMGSNSFAFGGDGVMSCTTGTIPGVSVTSTSGPHASGYVRSFSFNFAGPPTPGAAIIVVMSSTQVSGASHTTQVTDNQGNTYQRAAASAGSALLGEIYVATNIASSGTFTITATASRDVSFSLMAYQVTGLAASPVDAAGGDIINNMTRFSSVATDSPTSQANTIVFAGSFMNYPGSFPTSDSGQYTIQPGWTAAGNLSYSSERDFMIVATTLTSRCVPSHRWTHRAVPSNGVGVTSVIAAFKAATPGTDSTANGTPAIASEDNTFALGESAEASVEGGIAIGYRSRTRSGANSGVSIANNSITSKPNGVTIGGFGHSNGASNGIVIGGMSNGTGSNANYSIAMGKNASVSGTQSYLVNLLGGSTTAVLANNNVFSVMGGAAGVTTPTVPNGLVGRWKFDETSGTTVTDSAGTSNGTLTGGINWGNVSVAGKYVNGVSLASYMYTGAAVNIPDTAATNQIFGTGGGSLSVWLKPASSAALGRPIATKAGGQGWQLHYNTSSNSIIFAYFPTGTYGQWTATGCGAGIPVGSWSHVVVSYNQDSLTTPPVIYVNGSACSSVTTDSTPSGSPSAESLAIRMGVDEDAAFDDLRLYSNMLAAGDVTQLYNSATGDTTVTTGIVGIGTTSPSAALEVVGTTGLSTGTLWTNTSDRRLKDIRGDYTRGLADILQLQPVRFNYKKDNPRGNPSDHEYAGFIAQDVMPYFPEAVKRGEDGYYDFDMHSINVAMVNALQELDTARGGMTETAEDMDGQAEALRRRLSSLEGDIARIENAASGAPDGGFPLGNWALAPLAALAAWGGAQWLRRRQGP